MAKEDSKKIDLLIQNSISLQKAMAALAVNLDRFSRDIGKLLDFLSESAKTFESEEKERGAVAGAAISGDLVRKLDMLIDQNKTIAKGLVLLENYLKEKIETGSKTEFKSW